MEPTATNNIPSQPNPVAISKWFPRAIFLILGVVVVIEVISGIKTLRTPPAQTAATSSQVQPVSGGKLALVAEKSSYKVGETILVRAKVDSGGHSTLGTDLVFKYDPYILQASSAAFVKGSIYSNYIPPLVDNKNGIIKVSGIAPVGGKPFNGAGDFGFFSFLAKAPGKTALTFDYRPNETADSNVIDSVTQKDILNQVTNLDLNITR